MNLPYQTFLDGEMMGWFWEIMKFILFYVAPIVMIWFAIQLVGFVIKVIRGTTDEAAYGDDEDDRRRRTKDENYY